MKLELITNEFKNMVVKAAKAASNDKLVTMTTYLGIEVKNNKLYLRTTDGANFLIISKPVKSADFSVVVECDTFVNLIKKTSSEHITLVINEDTVEVRGNGNYKIPVIADEHGEIFKFPEAEAGFELDGSSCIKVKSKVFKTVFEANTASVSKVLDVPVLTGFYFGDKVITTDTMKLCAFNVDVFRRPTLLPLELVKLSALFTEEDVFVYFFEEEDGTSDIVIQSDNLIVLGKEMPDIETYPREALDNLLGTEYPSECSIKKILFTSTLDRLSLFVNDYEKNAITLSFTKEGLIVSSSKATEKIPYDTSSNFKPFECKLELPKVKEQVNTLNEDIVQFKYGIDGSIRMDENKIIHILATLEEL